ncbi:MAG: iron-sulfur cluster assembly protein [Candidatus Nanopelagicales bacterium]
MTSPRYVTVELDRTCVATVIPGGQTMTLEPGERITVVQTLGGSATVQTEVGYLVRIGADDSAALGLTDSVPSDGKGPAEVGPFDVDQVIEQLKNVFDPEIPINVVDLGLIYDCDAYPLDDGGQRIEIRMSMTAPGCGMGDILKEDARTAAESVPGVREVDVELVWDPPWGLERMSESARLQLGMY